MVASKHTTNFPSQTPHGEVINNEPIPPPLEDIPGGETRYYEITRAQLRALSLSKWMLIPLSISISFYLSVSKGEYCH